jgi:two-component system, LytTR family, sensor histidine kinase AlgZ
MKLPISIPAWLRALAINFALWGVLCALAGITTYGDAQLHGDTRSYWQMTFGWWRGYVVMMVQSYALYMVCRRYPALLATPRRMAASFAVYVVLGWPSAMLGLGAWRTVKLHHELSFDNAWGYVVSMYKFEWFVGFVLLTMAFGAVAAGLLWRQRQQQASELAQAKLSLERQRLAALRGQLEPHFMFNTLSAIGALVRVGDKPLALDGLARLGDLLQYALSSSERDWITMEQELQFVHDYLDLQRLRFGPRLQVRIDGTQALDGGIECPPMLLQPLVENALRHDLECHEDASDIVVAFANEGARLLVRVSNPVPSHAAPQAGLGIGLRGTRARLRLAYGEAASLETRHADGRFVAELRIPRMAA